MYLVMILFAAVTVLNPTRILRPPAEPLVHGLRRDREVA